MENETISIIPRCKKGWPHYISADSIWYPCCYVSTIHKFWSKDWFNLNKAHFNTKDKKLQDILDHPKLKELESLWHDERGRHAPYWCKKMCGRKGKKKITVTKGSID